MEDFYSSEEDYNILPVGKHICLLIMLAFLCLLLHSKEMVEELPKSCKIV